jgi:putative aldouronate transport system permease protein
MQAKLEDASGISRAKPKKKTLAFKFKKYKSIVWFILPAFVFAAFFGYVPMLGVLFAFKDNSSFDLIHYTVLGAFIHSTWTFENFTAIWSNSDFILAIQNTLTISSLKILICFPLALLIALALSELRNQNVARIILIILCLPNFLSWSIVSGIFNNFLSDQGGLLNVLLVKIGVLDEEFWFLGSNGWFKPLVILLAGWKESGWNSILFYAAIMSIDKTYYEAAMLDGASKTRRTWSLTIPEIMPIIALTLILDLTYILSAGFEEVYTLMTSETRYSQETLETYLYDISILNRSNTPFATALGVFNGVVSLVFMISGNAICKRLLGKGLW